MRNVVDAGEHQDRSDSVPCQPKATVGRRVVRLADGHVAVSGDEDSQTDRCRLTDEDERVRVQADVVPADRTVVPFVGIDETQQIID